MKKTIWLLLCLFLLAGCTQTDDPVVHSDPLKNQGGFSYESCCYYNGSGYADYPEITGLEGAGEYLTELNELIKKDAVAPFGSEDLGYQGTFLTCEVNDGILTVEFSGTYDGEDHRYTVHTFENYSFRGGNYEKVSFVNEGLLAAIRKGEFTMPERETYTAIWESQKQYILTHEIAAEDLTCALLDGRLYVTVAVSHALYDVCVVVADKGLIS